MMNFPNITQTLQSQEVLLKQVWYNANYWTRKYLQQAEDSEYNESYILGKKISAQNNIESMIADLIWFSYRKDMDFIIRVKEMKQFTRDIQVNNDVGWGCMIRAAQMLLSNLYYKHIKTLFKFKEVNFDLRTEIIKLFNDSMLFQKDAPFSIQNFLKVAQEELQMQPEQWFSPNQIIYCMDKILQDYVQFYPSQDTKTIKKRPQNIEMIKLEIYTNNENWIDLNTIIAQVAQSECVKQIDFYDRFEKISKQATGLLEQHQKKQKQKQQELLATSDYEILKTISQTESELSSFNREITEIIYHNILQCVCVCKNCLDGKNFRRLWINVLSRVGCDKPNEQYLNGILYLMKKSYFSGMIGGRPKQGLYFYGNINDRFAYLDPHIVQSVQYESELEYLKTFSCEDLLLVKREDIDCSIGITFYIEDLHQLAGFIADNLYLKILDQQFIGIGAKKQFQYSITQSLNEFLKRPSEQRLIYENEFENKFKAENQIQNNFLDQSQVYSDDGDVQVLRKKSDDEDEVLQFLIKKTDETSQLDDEFSIIDEQLSDYSKVK